jgi:arylsulfate sulfotransferase
MKQYLLFIAMLMLFSCRKDKQDLSSVDVSLPVLNIAPDSVKLNPYGNAPLSALVSYNTLARGHTKIVVKGQDGPASDISQEFNDNGLTHSIPILGLYPNYNNSIDVYLVDDGENNLSKTTLNIQTGTLPPSMPNYTHVDDADYTQLEPGLNLVSSLSNYPSAPEYPYIVDNYGKIRWYLDYTNNAQLNKLFYDCGISRLRNGNFYFADRASGHIYEIDILGKIIQSWSFPGYDFHHEVLEMPNGNFLITVDKHGSTNANGETTYEDYVLEIDRNNNTILKEWDLKQSLDAYRTTLTSDHQDWIHTNAIVYDSSDNTIIISGRTQGVIKLTFDNRVKWILGPHKGWGQNGRNEDLNQFLLTPLDLAGNKITDTAYTFGYANHPDFEWNWYQHSPILMPNGDLMIFDNGSERNYNPNGPLYSRAVEFKIDPVNMTVKQIWEYGKERGQDTYSMIISSVQYLPNTNHILFAPGFYVPNGFNNGGKILEIDYATKKLIFQMSLGAINDFGFHRAKRFDIYPNNNSYRP